MGCDVNERDFAALKENEIVKRMAQCQEIFWNNAEAAAGENLPQVDIDGAEARLKRFAPYIERVFPQVRTGIIESPLEEISGMKAVLEGKDEIKNIPGRLFLKCDNSLPISGSIKARGGIYEVLKLAEGIAADNGMLREDDNYVVLAEEKYRELFSKYKIAVGSTGNLGLSIGIISATLGFQVTVHMSADARQWKKDLLRSKGVKVVEYPGDYGKAITQGRIEAEADSMCHFVDDENSMDLFEGYAVAGKRLKKQLDDKGITVNDKNRLYVYLPCGVGGAPGGVTYGIKKCFGENAFCYFAEPTHAPCMTLGMVTKLHDKICVNDIGIDGKTEADGLAVGRASKLVSRYMQQLLDGCFTVDDSRLYGYLSKLKDTEGIFIEPSACAGFLGLGCFDEMIIPPDENSIHIIWATGGEMVPEEEKEMYYMRGREAE